MAIGVLHMTTISSVPETIGPVKSGHATRLA